MSRASSSPVSASVPTIFSPDFTPVRATVSQRLLALTVALACVAPLVVAAQLTPSPTGVGTHSEMGFASCQFLDRTGLPCPTCGMTTSFAWFARGNLLASAYVQPMGFVGALLAAAGFWIGLYIAVTGRPVVRLLQMVPYRYYLIPLLTFAVGAWGWKMFLILHHIDGWR
jgi:hypothetical protein